MYNYHKLNYFCLFLFNFSSVVLIGFDILKRLFFFSFFCAVHPHHLPGLKLNSYQIKCLKNPDFFSGVPLASWSFQRPFSIFLPVIIYVVSLPNYMTNVRFSVHDGVFCSIVSKNLLDFLKWI